MQVYHPTKDLYLFRDKYFGRSLDADGFEQALRDFFHDGERVVDEVVAAFVARMEKMRRAVLLWTRGRRFYSSSLLLVYEGDRKTRAGDAQLGAQDSEGLERTTSVRQESDSAIAIAPVASSQQTMPSASTPRPSNGAAQPLASSPAHIGLSTSLPSSSSSTASGRATLPASFSSSALSRSFQYTAPSPSTTDDCESAAASSASFASAFAAPGSAVSPLPPPPSQLPPAPPTATMSSSSSLVPPVKLYSHKRKTTHAQAMALARQRGNIDVRIIDFAHTSVVDGDGHGRVENDRDAVDVGLLFGFDHLLDLLRRILAAPHAQQQRSPHHAAQQQQEREQRSAEAPAALSEAALRDGSVFEQQAAPPSSSAAREVGPHS